MLADGLCLLSTFCVHLSPPMTLRMLLADVLIFVGVCSILQQGGGLGVFNTKCSSDFFAVIINACNCPVQNLQRLPPLYSPCLCVYLSWDTFELPFQLMKGCSGKTNELLPDVLFLRRKKCVGSNVVHKVSMSTEFHQIASAVMKGGSNGGQKQKHPGIEILASIGAPRWPLIIWGLPPRHSS